MSILLEILSKCPRKRNQGPAMEIWSVVHLPFTLMSTGILLYSSGFGALNASSFCSLLESGAMTTWTADPSSAGATNPFASGTNPPWGSSVPMGGLSAMPLMGCLVKSTVRSPVSANPMTVSGDATKAWVSGLPSLRDVKLRLNDVMMELRSPFCTSCLFHCPMHGPQALARTVPPTDSSFASMPSRSMVARTCSEPGVMVNSLFVLSPCWAA